MLGLEEPSTSGGSPLSNDHIIDNTFAAAFGNASAGPTAAKILQYLGAGSRARELVSAELAARGSRGPLTAADLDSLPYTSAGARRTIHLVSSDLIGKQVFDRLQLLLHWQDQTLGALWACMQLSA